VNRERAKKMGHADLPQRPLSKKSGQLAAFFVVLPQDLEALRLPAMLHNAGAYSNVRFDPNTL